MAQKLLSDYNQKTGVVNSLHSKQSKNYRKLNLLQLKFNKNQSLLPCLIIKARQCQLSANQLASLNLITSTVATQLMNLQNILSQQRRLHLSLSTVNETLLLCRKLVRNQIASHQFNGLSINPFKAVNWSSFVSRRFSHQEGKGQLMILLPQRNFWN